MGDTIAMFFPITLVLLFFISLAFFVSTLLKNQRQRAVSAARIEKKLDRIIELLEKDNGAS